MKRIGLYTMWFLLYGLACRAINLPDRPDIHPLESIIQRPSTDGNAADFYLKAEELFKVTTNEKSPDEIRKMKLSEDSEVIKLVLTGLKYRKCVFPYSLDITVPPYETMIPMMSLYTKACSFFCEKGDKALKDKEYDKAKESYSNAVILGLHLFEDPGITILQDMISTKCLAMGITGLGDLFIALGENSKAEICKQFLIQKSEFTDSLSRFMKTVLSRPCKMSDDFQEAAVIFPTIRYLSIKLEILIFACELHILADDPKTRSICAKIIDDAKKDPDNRIQKVAVWGESLNRDELLKATGSVDMGIPE